MSRRREAKTSKNKKSFSRIMDLSSQKLSVRKSLSPCIFIISVILNTVWWVKECKSHKMDFISKLRRTNWLPRTSHRPDCALNLQLLFSHLNLSDLGTDYLPCYKDIRMTKFWQWGAIFVEAGWILFTCATILHIKHKENLVWLPVWQFFPYNLTYQINLISLANPL